VLEIESNSIPRGITRHIPCGQLNYERSVGSVSPGESLMINEIIFLVSYAIVFSIVTVIFTYIRDKKKRDIDNLTRKWKKFRDKLQQAIEEINACEGIVALKKSVGKVRTILSPYYGHTSIVSDKSDTSNESDISKINDIITGLDKEKDNVNLEERKIDIIQIIDRVSKREYELSQKEINNNTQIRTIIIMAMVNFFLFSTYYILRNISSYLLWANDNVDERMFTCPLSKSIKYLQYNAITVNIIFLYIVGKNYEYSKKTEESTN